MNNKEINKFGRLKGVQYGVMAGASMGLFLFLLKYMGVELSTGVKFSKYLILLTFIFVLLNRLRQTEQADFFTNGIRLGATASVFSAVGLLLVNAASWFLGGASAALAKFGNESNSFGEFLMMEGLIFFEVIVFGMVATFISLQFLKNKNQSESRVDAQHE